MKTSSAKHQLLPYLEHGKPAHYDLSLSIHLQPAEGASGQCRKQMPASSIFQPAAARASGLDRRAHAHRRPSWVGTISGPDRHSRGSFLEMSWGGQDPLMIDGVSRAFLQDGDTVTLTGAANADTFRIGFGDCSGRIAPSGP